MCFYYTVIVLILSYFKCFKEDVVIYYWKFRLTGKEKLIFKLPIHSPRVDHSQKWARLTLGARNFILVFTLVAGVQVQELSSPAFPGLLAGSWNGSKAIQLELLL